jgi:hypothetical protein
MSYQEAAHTKARKGWPLQSPDSRGRMRSDFDEIGAFARPRDTKSSLSGATRDCTLCHFLSRCGRRVTVLPVRFDYKGIGARDGGTDMGLARAAHCCVVVGGLAVVLYAALGNPDGDLKATLARLDARPTLASSHAALVAPDLRAVLSPSVAALAAPDVAVARPDSDLGAARPYEDASDVTGLAGKVALAKPDVDPNSPKTSEECLLDEVCVDQYLWVVYDRARKVDTVKVEEQVKVTVKTKGGKTRTVTKTITKFVDEDFTWKDPQAAEKAGMSMSQYVLGGMDREFKGRLYRLFHALDDAGFIPGMTSGFRDDYRQSIASGNKAAINRSYHGGSLRGGYGHGLAADVVSMRGETRVERAASSEILWKWIDKHGSEFGIGRPYLDRDPPHIAPIDGREYADKRGVKPKQAGLSEKEAPRPAPVAARVSESAR